MNNTTSAASAPSTSAPATAPACSCPTEEYTMWCYAMMGSRGGCGGCPTCQSARQMQETCPVHGSSRSLR